MILRNLKKYVSNNKMYLDSKKKSNVSLNKKVIFVFHKVFATITVLSTDACIPFSYFFCSLILVSKKRNFETMLTLPYLYDWQKFNDKMNEKRSQEYQSMDPENVTEQINRRILKLLLRRFCC